MILLPFSGIGAVTGNWLAAASMALAGLSGSINLRALRRRGIDGSGPATFRELRERQRTTDE